MKFIKEHRIELFISLTFIILIPLVMAVLMQTIFSSFGGGTDDGWLGFWGGYIGSIFSGLIAYGVARYQILKERELRKIQDIEKQLPYFDIGLSNADFKIMEDGKLMEAKNPLILSSMNQYVPLEHVDLYIYDKEDRLKNFESLGHVFPSTGISRYSFDVTPAKVNITSKLSNTEFFFSYGLNVVDLAAYRINPDDEWTLYSGKHDKYVDARLAEYDDLGSQKEKWKQEEKKKENG